MAGPPDAPEGHQGPIEYTNSNLVSSVLQVGLLLATLRLFFPGAVTALATTTPFDKGDTLQYLSQHESMAMVLVVFLPTMVVVHEAIHYAAGKWRGHNPQFGFRIHWNFRVIPEPNPYVVTLDRFINKRDNIIALAAPLLVLNALALLGWLLPMMPSIVDYLSRVVLVVNTTFSVMDIYNVAKVASASPGTLFRNFDSEGEVDTVFYPPRC